MQDSEIADLFVAKSDEKVDRSDRSFRAVAQTRLIGKSKHSRDERRLSRASDIKPSVRGASRRASRVGENPTSENDVDDDDAFQTYDARFRVSRGRSSPHARLAQCPTSRTHR
jgi:hypothetical protein